MSPMLGTAALRSEPGPKLEAAGFKHPARKIIWQERWVLSLGDYHCS